VSAPVHSRDLRNIMSSVLCTELAAQLDQLDRLLEATNRNNIAQNGNNIKLFIIFYCIFWSSR